MKTIFLIAALHCIVNTRDAFAQIKNPSNKLSPAASLLFKNVKTRLTVVEKNNLIQKSKLMLSSDKKRFIIKEDPESNYYVDVYPVDLNKDGKEEIFVMESSTFFGNSGGQFSLYIKDANGIYQTAASALGIPMLLSTGNAGYPDLLIDSPGMEQPVWRYNGKSYAFYRRIKDDGKIKSTDITESSEAYVHSIR